MTLADSEPIVSPRAAREAAAWLLRLRDSGDSADERAACEYWRSQSAENECAWQRAQRLGELFGAVPSVLGLSALDRPDRDGRRRALKTLALLTTAVPAGWLLQRNVPWREWTADYRTVAGERHAITLADGSQLHLNSGSAVDIRFDERQRLLRLVDGEILIETAPDQHTSSRPFIVESNEGRIRALGTRFIVRQLAGATAVTVLEHAVEISPQDGGALLLPAGQQIRFTADSIDTPVPIQPRAGDWSRDLLIADRMPLGDFIDELSRHRPGLLRCDPAVADLRISGAFQLRDIDAVLAALPQTLPVQLHYRTRYWVTIAPADA